MNVRNKAGYALLSLVVSHLGAVVNAETCGPDVEDHPQDAPWKVRLYGANKDRRAARKKRAKKLGRRR